MDAAGLRARIDQIDTSEAISATAELSPEAMKWLELEWRGIAGANSGAAPWWPADARLLAEAIAARAVRRQRRRDAGNSPVLQLSDEVELLAKRAVIQFKLLAPYLLPDALAELERRAFRRLRVLPDVFDESDAAACVRVAVTDELVGESRLNPAIRDPSSDSVLAWLTRATRFQCDRAIAEERKRLEWFGGEASTADH
ncbi:MAG: hypothetical protein WAU78_05980 [Roseiarcus sp.]|jgi:hypothetical protein